MLFWIPTCFFGVFILVLYCIQMYCFETLFKVPISWLGILHILAVKINGSDVKQGICVTVNTRSYRHTENTLIGCGSPVGIRSASYD